MEKIFVKKFRQKLRHQVVEGEALRVEAEAIQKLPLLHPWFYYHLAVEVLFELSVKYELLP